MRALLTAVAVVFVALSVGCSQPISPTGPTSLPPGGPSITSSDANRQARVFPARSLLTARRGTVQRQLGRGRDGRTPLTPALLSSFRGTGNATHLGRFTVEIRTS